MASTKESLFRESMKQRRDLLGLNQTDLARQMKEAGFPFHQQTVQRVEAGERPIRLDEAYAIARILNTSVESMTQGSDLVAALGLADQVKAELIEAALSTAQALMKYREALGWEGEARSRLKGYDHRAAREASDNMSVYAFPLSAVAAWAVEVAEDDMRDEPTALEWKDLSRLGEISAAGHRESVTIEESIRAVEHSTRGPRVGDEIKVPAGKRIAKTSAGKVTTD